MNVFRGVLLVTAIVSLTACPKDDDEGDATTPAHPMTVAPEPPAPVVSTPAPIKPEVPAKATITPRVKSELDGRADGITGSPLAVSGAQASLQSPTGWTATKGDITVAATTALAAVVDVVERVDARAIAAASVATRRTRAASCTCEATRICSGAATGSARSGGS